MQKEINSLQSNKTCSLVDQMRDKFGRIKRVKSSLVAKSHSQQYDIHYTETFSPVVRFINQIGESFGRRTWNVYASN